MKVYIVFDFPEISDANSSDATFAIDVLSQDLANLSRDGEYEWYIDDAVGGWKMGEYIVYVFILLASVGLVCIGIDMFTNKE